MLFSLELFDMQVEKAAVFFDKIFNLMFLLCFSVIRWNFGIFWFFSTGEYYCWWNGHKLTQFINNMQRLTKQFDVVSSDPRVGYILNKSENATPQLFAIYMHNDAIQ